MFSWYTIEDIRTLNTSEKTDDYQWNDHYYFDKCSNNTLDSTLFQIRQPRYNNKLIETKEPYQGKTLTENKPYIWDIWILDGLSKKFSVMNHCYDLGPKFGLQTGRSKGMTVIWL